MRRWYKFLEGTTKKQAVTLDDRIKQVSGTLIIREAKVEDSGKYLCVVNNSVGGESVETVLTVTGKLDFEKKNYVFCSCVSYVSSVITPTHNCGSFQPRWTRLSSPLFRPWISGDRPRWRATMTGIRWRRSRGWRTASGWVRTTVECCGSTQCAKRTRACTSVSWETNRRAPREVPSLSWEDDVRTFQWSFGGRGGSYCTRKSFDFVNKKFFCFDIVDDAISAVNASDEHQTRKALYNQRTFSMY